MTKKGKEGEGWKTRALKAEEEMKDTISRLTLALLDLDGERSNLISARKIQEALRADCANLKRERDALEDKLANAEQDLREVRRELEVESKSWEVCSAEEAGKYRGMSDAFSIAIETLAFLKAG